jgi:hypothetical protein
MGRIDSVYAHVLAWQVAFAEAGMPVSRANLSTVFKDEMAKFCQLSGVRNWWTPQPICQPPARPPKRVG